MALEKRSIDGATFDYKFLFLQSFLTRFVSRWEEILKNKKKNVSLKSNLSKHGAAYTITRTAIDNPFRDVH